MEMPRSCVWGNLDAKRDWGHAKEYVVAMHAMLQQSKNRATTLLQLELHIRFESFVSLAFGFAGMNYADYVRD